MQRTTAFPIQLHRNVYVFKKVWIHSEGEEHLASVGQFQNIDPWSLRISSSFDLSEMVAKTNY
jgi:hypothetical protein